MTKKIYSESILLPIGRLHYAILDTPQVPTLKGEPQHGKPPRYEATIVFPDGEKAAEILKIQKDLAEKVFGKRASKPEHRWAVKKADEEMIEANPWYKNMVRIRTTAGEKFKPKLLLADKSAAVTGTFYPGCWVQGVVTLAPFDQNGGFGIKAFLNSIRFVRDGERLSTGADTTNLHDTSSDDDVDALIDSVMKNAGASTPSASASKEIDL